MESNITIITQIQTKPRPRFAKIGNFVTTYTPKTALSYERYIASEYQRLGGKYYGDKPIIVSLHFYFATPKSWPKYKLGLYQLVPCATHKDLDNLAKSILDALNTVAYADDKQITYLEVKKSWTTGQEKIRIVIDQQNWMTDKELKEQWAKLNH